MGKGDYLGELEHQVLLAVMRRRDNAYGVTIRQEILERTNRDISIGAIYTTLSRLEEKGFVSSHRGEPSPERGGRAKRYFNVEAPGIKALIQSRERMARMWDGLRPVEA